MPKGILNKASLVMVPEAPIDGTMPSVFPEDRSGDFTFTRGSNLAATRVASNGLIEKGRENLLVQSNQFDTTWTNYLASVTSGQPDKDGGSDAWLLSKSGASGRLLQNISNTNVSTYSIYAKAGTLDWILLFVLDSSVNPKAYFDLSNGTIGTNNDIIDSNIEDVGNGWYRCSITYNKTITQVRVFPADEDNDTSGTSGSIYIQDAQLEVGLVATGYIESGATTGKAGLLENEPRIDFTGGGCGSLLLEPQRTNLITQSEYFGAWVDAGTTTILSTTTNPSGYSQSYIISAASSATNALRYDLTFSASTDYSYSLFLKAGTSEEVRMQIYDGNTYQRLVVNPLNDFAVVDQSGINSYSIEDFSNGWKRVSMNFSSTASAGVGYLQIYPDRTGNLNNVEVYGAQLEQGSYPTSYIPTHGNIVTRSYDECDLNSMSEKGISTNNNWTILLDYKNFRSNQYATYFYALGGEIMHIFASSVGYRNTSNAQQYVGDWSLSPYNDGKTPFKIAFQYDGVNLTMFHNGVKKSSIANSNLNANFANNFNRLRIAWHQNNPRESINQAAFFDTALTDEECSALTQP